MFSSIMFIIGSISFWSLCIVSSFRCLCCTDKRLSPKSSSSKSRRKLQFMRSRRGLLHPRRASTGCCGQNVCVSSLVLVLLSALALYTGSRKQGREHWLHAAQLGPIGQSMVEMLGQDLPFTVFVPNESSFQRIFRYLELRRSASDAEYRNESMILEEKNAIVSRVLGFSAVPVHLLSTSLRVGEELEAESISGYKLYVAKDPNRGLVVNSISSEASDMWRGMLVVHIVSGVLMDSDFQRSVVDPDDQLNQQA